MEQRAREKNEIQRGLKKILEFGAFCNQYFQKKEPWKTKDKDALLTLANIVKDTFMRLNVLLNNPDYNFYIKDCSLNNNGRIPIKEIRELSYHWYIDLSPRLTKASSWEYSTDVWINPICPEKAADDLRKVRVS